MIFVYVHPADLALAMERFPDLFAKTEGNAIITDVECPRGRVISSSTPIYDKPLAS